MPSTYKARFNPILASMQLTAAAAAAAATANVYLPNGACQKQIISLLVALELESAILFRIIQSVSVHFIFFNYN